MRIVLVGSGGVGDAFARIATRRPFFEQLVVADYDPERAERTVAAVGDERFVAAQVDASDAESVAALVRAHQGTHVMNAVDPRFVMPIFDGAYAAGADYLDMAMSLSHPDPERPYEEVGVKLGDEQFAKAGIWERAGRLALVGMGVEPGLSDVFARYAADELFDQIDELGTRDGSNLAVRAMTSRVVSIWTTIEECLNPPVIWEADRGWFVTAPLSEPETFDFPGGIGPVECVNVEHEEVLLMPRWVPAQRVTFKYGLGGEFIDVLKTLHKLGLDRTRPVTVRGTPAGGDAQATAVQVSPRDVVAACLPDPAFLGDAMRGKTCAGSSTRPRRGRGRRQPSHVGGGRGQHRLDGPEHLEPDGLQPRPALLQGDGGGVAEIPGQHARPPDDRRRHLRRLGHCLGHDPFKCPLPKPPGQQIGDEVDLRRGRPGQDGIEDGRPGPHRSRAGGAGQFAQRLIEFGKGDPARSSARRFVSLGTDRPGFSGRSVPRLQPGRIGRRDSPTGGDPFGQCGPADADPALAGFADQESDGRFDLVGVEAAEQVGQRGDLGAAGGRGRHPR